MNDAKQNRKDDARRTAEAKRKLRSNSGVGNSAADWAGCDGVLLAKMVAAISADGGACRLGYTRDGGAYAVGIYGDGDPYTVYVSPSEDINEWLKSATEDFSK